MTTRHNRLRDCLFRFLQLAKLSPSLEKGASFGDASRPADILVPHWSLGKSAALDLTVVSPLTSRNLSEAGDHDAVSLAAEEKHKSNDPKCAVLGWHCVPIVVDSYGRWGDEAQKCISWVADKLTFPMRVSHSQAMSSIYNALGVILARHNAIAILARNSLRDNVGKRELLNLGRH